MSTPYIALYPGDFLADTGHLGNTELGIYWRLLLVYYRDGRPLPTDMDRLRRLAMTFSPEECRVLESVVAEFFTLSTEPDGRRVWRHKRADQEIARATNAHERRSAAARATNQKRWGKASLSDSPSESLGDIAKRPNSDGEPEPELEPQVIPSSTTCKKVAKDDAKAPPVAPADCPHQEIVKLFAQHLPMARQPAEWNASRQALLRTRWKEKANRQNLEWWSRFFAYVARSDFLTGKSGTAGRKPFELDLPWLLKAENFLKVVEGKYHSEAEA